MNRVRIFLTVTAVTAFMILAQVAEALPRIRY